MDQITRTATTRPHLPPPWTALPARPSTQLEKSVGLRHSSALVRPERVQGRRAGIWGSSLVGRVFSRKMGEWWTSMTMGSGLETHPAQTKSKSRDEAKTDKKIPFTSMTMGSESVSIVYKNM
jgi:hypothetical protein